MAAEKTIRARVPGSEYDIIVRPGLLADAGRQLRHLSQSKKAAVITDNSVGSLYLDSLRASLQRAAFELRTGLADCVKHDIIRDATGFAELEQNIGKAIALELDYLTDLIAHNVAIKARVVETDPFEKAERAHLNFGHTFGHAIETVSHYTYAHGECVALGMVAATRMAVTLGMLDEACGHRITRVIHRAGLPV